MKILIISAGVSFNSASQNSYLEEYIGALLEKGIALACLYTALWHCRPGIHVDRTVGDPMIYRIYNGGIYPGTYPDGGVGTKSPMKDIRSRSIFRKIFLDVLSEVKPDIVHFQNFMGFPLELVEEIRRQGIRTVFTAHDYLPVCPTAHLFLPTGSNCTLSDHELVCNDCCRYTPRYTTFWFRKLLQNCMGNFKTGSPIWKLLCYMRNVIVLAFERLETVIPSPQGYSDRRSAFRKYLRMIDVIICISNVQRNVIGKHLGFTGNIKLMRLSRKSIQTRSLERVQVKPDGAVVVFAALNVSSRMKGDYLLRNAFEQIETTRGGWQLRVYGNGKESHRVQYLGHYSHHDLDVILQDVDFGIVPSVWWETYGFTGAEMLARGIPIIVSNRAGVSELVREGVNGLTFDPSSEAGLRTVVERVLDSPELRHGLRLGARSLQGEVPGWDRHLQETQELYRWLMKGLAA